MNGNIKNIFMRVSALFLILVFMITACSPAAPESTSVPAAEDTSEHASAESAGDGAPGEVPSEDPDFEEADTEDMSEEYVRALAKRNQVYSVGASDLTHALTPQDPVRDYTVMVYMIGSNLESSGGCASTDIEEMEAAGLDYSRTNLLLYTGGSMRWSSDIPCDRNCVLDMSRPSDDRIVASTSANADMGAPDTLASFINFCTEYYPAEHYALIMWDHGGGPLWGYGSDELFEGDGLMLSEMDQAMNGTVFAGGRKLDLVGFDACLMGCLESMTVWSTYADYYVASEELEPGDGWDYSFLSSLNTADGPLEIAGSILDSYESYYGAKRSERYDPDLTLSVADLSQIRAVQRAVSALSEELADTAGSGGFNTVQVCRSDTKSFGRAVNSEDGFAYDLADLSDLAAKMGSALHGSAAAVQSAVSDLIVMKYANVEGAGGVSIYYPSSNRSQFYGMRSIYSALNLNKEYLGFLRLIGHEWQNAPRNSYDIPAPARDGDSYVMRLDPSLTDNIASVSYSILERYSDGAYAPLLTGVKTEPGADRTVSLPADPRLIEMYSGSASTLWPVAQVESSSSRDVYRTAGTRLLSSGIHYYFRSCAQFEDITAVLSEGRRSGVLTLQTVNTVSDDIVFSGKETVDVSNYDSIYYTIHEKIPVWNSAGDLLPFSEWKENGVSGSTLMNLYESFGFRFIPASECRRELYYIVTIEDVYGAQYTSEPVRIEPERGYETIEVHTDNGLITYSVYSDHAVVTEYLGNDREIVIPPTVNGVPVTEIGTAAFGRLIIGDTNGYTPVERVTLPDTVTAIGPSAFRCCRRLEYIHLSANTAGIGAGAFAQCEKLSDIPLPAGLKEIGVYAFTECSSLTEISVPAGIQSIGCGVFSGCTALRSIKLGAGCTAYTVKDGVLYTADGITLLAYPAALTGSYKVAEGTEVIGQDAFCGSALSEVILPESLRVIKNYAFYGSALQTVPVLPASLGSIGHYAFAAGWTVIDIDDIPEAPQGISLGPNVINIGPAAFCGFPARSYTVDPANPRFSSVDGALMNKAGDSLCDCAANRTLSFTVPDGCVNLDFGIFAQIEEYDRYGHDGGFHIYIPDSVVRISGNTLYAKYIIIHCSPGSQAEAFAEGAGIPVSYDTLPVYREYQLPAGSGRMTFLLGSSGAILTGYTGEDTVLDIPDTADGLPVTGIGDGAKPIVSGNKTLTAVHLPDTIKTINAHAFEFIALEELTIPDTVETIGDRALYSVPIPVSLPASLKHLGSEACAHYGPLHDELVIPGSLESMSYGAFSQIAVGRYVINGESGHFSVREGSLYSADGKELIAAATGRGTAFTVPEGTEVIWPYAFSGSRITDIALPSSVREIGPNAFYGCSYLRQVDLSEGLEVIGERAFYGTRYLKEISLPESCRQIGESAFAYSDALETADIYAADIAANAFAGCKALHTVTLHEGLETIGDRAFRDTAITYIELPDSLRSIGQLCFSTYSHEPVEAEPFTLHIGSGLRSISSGAFSSLPVSAFEVSPDNQYYRSTDGLLTSSSGRTLLGVPGALTGRCDIPDGIYDIEHYALYGCRGLTDLYIPDSVQVIYSMAFGSGWSSSSDGSSAITVHCSPGSYAEDWCILRGWPCTLEK